MELNLFKQRFNALSQQEQTLLKLLSLAYEAIPYSTLVQMLNELAVTNSKGQSFKRKDLDDIRELLDAGDWLRYGPRNGVGIADKYRELTLRLAAADPDFKSMATLLRRQLPYKAFMSMPYSFDACMREMRLSLCEGAQARTMQVIKELERFFTREWLISDFFNQAFYPFDPDWPASLPADSLDLVLATLLSDRMESLEPMDDLISYVNKYRPPDQITEERTFSLLHVLPAIQQGRFHSQYEHLRSLPLKPEFLDALGCFAFFCGHNDEALKCFRDKFKAEKTRRPAQKGSWHGFSPVVFALALLKDRTPENLDTLRRMFLSSLNPDYPIVWQYLQFTLLSLLGQKEKAKELDDLEPYSALDWVFYGASRLWAGKALDKSEVSEIKEVHFLAARSGHNWIALELALLVAEFVPDRQAAASYAETAAALEKKTGTHSILHVIQRQENWERTLDALLLLLQQGKQASKAAQEKSTRLAWLVDLSRPRPLVQPVEQTLGKSGWTKGRNVALKRLKDGQVDNMSNQDRSIAASIKANQAAGYYSHLEYYFDLEQMLPAMVGHPCLFLMENPAVSVELIEGKPQLLVEKKKGQYLVSFSYQIKGAGIHLVKETPTRYILLKISEQQAMVNGMLDDGRLLVPETAKGKLLSVIEKLSTVVGVQADIGEDSISMPALPANPLPHVHLLPSGNGFKLEFFVKPFTTDPPYFKPGKGRENVMAEIGGQPLRVHRDLELEARLALEVEEACSTLHKAESENQEWLLDQVEDSLGVLLELEPLRKEGRVVLEYPRGEKLRIAGTVSFGQLSLGIRRERDWFNLEGQVRVDEHLVVDFRELLEKSRQTDSRFVEISEGKFLALTSQLKRKLDELNTIFTTSKTDIRLHPLAAHVFDDFAGQLQELSVDKAWKSHIARIKQAQAVRPEVPSTLKAELRPYQVQGFHWLSQLAHWGVGACLADDMGLGKTVQTLALLLNRAGEGPAMVVAPASVVRNWYHETLKFAPTLRPIVFSEGDRREIVGSLQPFDLLLVSYGLLQQESELLAGQLFTTIVLDEAQAIKNRATKRSQAAMKLQASFKMITTGTPLENHLGELWNLFQFLNPGLLGSLDRFNENFAVPIERNQDKDKRLQLRHLLKPFLLRRRKNDVLDELPPKTEIVLAVELSPDERAFYEALRRQALSNIESTAGEATDKRFKILAELMRLRQAACHPRLIQPDSLLPSSKLNLLAETIEDLREEGHKALIFSQFVKHLKIVEEWVKKQGIPYQYLDGSTPLPQRDKAIRAFQAGEGDLFLISLKAGGFGLNLTAADYVIHLDPWWNPAVEDQASDRAHRIGQLRPVTIYRLVSENTIEDKIVRLHGEKRELADSLLEGTEISGKISAEELLDLMRS